MLNAKAAEAAHDGATLLDAHDSDWHRKVDTERLDIGLEGWCILGQLHGSYMNGLAVHQLQPTDAAKLGFVARSGGPAYNELTEAWRAEILLRIAMDNMRKGVATHLAVTEDPPSSSRGGGTNVKSNELVIA